MILGDVRLSYFYFHNFSLPLSPSPFLTCGRQKIFYTSNTKQQNRYVVSFGTPSVQISTGLLGLNNVLKELLLVTIVASQTRGTMEQQCCGNSYSVQHDLFIYTSARSHRPRTLTKAQATDRWTILIKIVRELACDLFKCLCIGMCVSLTFAHMIKWNEATSSSATMV